MRQVIWTAGFALGLVMIAPSAVAGCWTCDVNDCCKEAPQNTTGYGQCSNNVICLSGYGCACYSCQQSGNLCAGTGPAQCDNPNGICEEHQGFSTVPHGEELNLHMLVAPPISNPSEAGEQYLGETCTAV